MITIGGLLFFGMRHIIDSYNLLTVNRKEINSSSGMFRKILITFQLAVILLQLCLISYLSINGYLSCAALLALTFFISCLVIILTNKSLFDIAKQDPNIFNDEVKIPTDEDGNIEINENSQLYIPIMKWR